MNSKIKKILMIISGVIIGISLVGCKSTNTKVNEPSNNISLKKQDNSNTDVRLSKEKLVNNDKEEDINTKVNDKKIINTKEQEKEVSLYNNKALLKKGKLDTTTDTIINKSKHKVYNAEKKQNKLKIKNKPLNNSNSINSANNFTKLNKAHRNLEKDSDKKVQVKKEMKELKEVENKTANNFVYSSMSDSGTQKEIARVLTNAGVKNENIDRFISYIKSYDSIVGKLRSEEHTSE